jgi:hypothetical protein
MKNLKTLQEFIKENTQEEVETFIMDLEYDGEKLELHKYEQSPFKVLYYLVNEDGEDYIDLNTTLEDNLLLDAIWVKVGGQEEEISDMIDMLEKTDKVTSNGFNKYVMYDIK